MFDLLIDIPSLDWGKKGVLVSELVGNIIRKDRDFGTLSFKDSDNDGLFDSFEYLIGTDIQRRFR